MPAQLLTRKPVLVEDHVRQEAQAVLNEAHDRRVTGATVTLDDGQQIELPFELAKLVQSMLSGLTQGGVSIRSVPNELTTTTAADILGVSRPTLMKLVEAGELASHLVGTHHRFVHRDVVELAERRSEARRRAFEALRAFDEELGIED
jgi:excisionase family DNA binding protein